MRQHSTYKFVRALAHVHINPYRERGRENEREHDRPGDGYWREGQREKEEWRARGARDVLVSVEMFSMICYQSTSLSLPLYVCAVVVHCR